ncbi:MAG TPA: SCP2 sterol-binding domain-containing protein [Ktedonobacterales bacterium]|nr:SCP2 sterol-binding domain-containing protein [Ktedonobacterales bacterium]
MSSQNPSQPAQQAAAGTPGDEVARFFRSISNVRSQPRLQGLRGVCRFDITGAGSWSVAVNEGEVTVIEGAGKALSADCTVSCSAEDFQRIMHREGYMNLVTAAMQNLVTVTGDKVFAMGFLGNVVVAAPESVLPNW